MSGSVRKILLIEDNIGDTRLIREMLNEAGDKYAPATADRLSSGLKLLEEEAFDVVLLDLGLPDSVGLDTLRKLQDKKPELPVIVLTGLADEELAVQAIGLGAQDYLVKGRIDGNLLVRTIRYAIERIRAEEAVRESEARLRMIASAAQDAVILIDNDGNVSFWNDAATRMFGYTKEEIAGRYLHSFIMPGRYIDLSTRGFETFRVTGEEPLIGTVYEIEAKRKDGTEFPVELSLAALNLKGKWNAIGIVRDISERKKTEEALRESEKFLETIIENAPVCVKLVAADGSLLRMNHAGLALIGAESLDQVKGKSIYPLVSSEYRRAFIDLTQKVFQGKSGTLEFEIVGLKGKRLLLNTHAVPLYNDKKEIIALLGITVDVTEGKRLEGEIRHMANHDPLTDLPNRRLFREIAAIELAQANRNGKKLAILFLDLDRFKEINDTLGHEIGDGLLKQVADRVRSSVRRSDTIARIGGDEFNMIIADVARAEDVADIAAKIVQSFRRSFMLGPHEFLITTSIGISVYPDDGGDIDTLLRYADIAMYYAKDCGRNNYQFYNPEINIRSLERMRLESSLRRTVERSELIMHYQPLIEINSNRLVCAEALARWRHPEMGLLDPERFIPLAEETGFISAIDEWALRKVCEQIKEWTDSGFHPPCVTVNLSARQFQNPELVDKVAGVLRETGISPDLLEIEITESTAMKNVERTVQRLQQLKKMGISILIDDFGTGYSSLSYLKRFPIQKLKIDQSFIRDIATDPDDRAIINAVTSMARKMSIRTVAEGVETEEQLSFLRASECDEAQGFLFSRPLPPEKFRELVVSGK